MLSRKRMSVHIDNSSYDIVIICLETVLEQPVL